MRVVTTDHWTWPGQAVQTYSVTTYHYISYWKMSLFLLDLKVFAGTTLGKAVFEDKIKVLRLTHGQGALFFSLFFCDRYMLKHGESLIISPR